MGLFDIFKSKEAKLQELFNEVHREVFPKGERDIDAAINELLHILNNKIDRQTARGIILKSVLMSKMSEKFDRERLVDHLKRYCIQHFNDEQITMFYDYITTIHIAKMLNGKTPSEIERNGDVHSW